MPLCFAPPSEDTKHQEQCKLFAPRFDANGLLTAVVSDAGGNLLMVAFMNAQAVSLTLETGIAHFWSRSRKSLWKKGETSGNLLHVMEVRTDCDQDALWLKVRAGGQGAACHTGARSCFYRQLSIVNGVAELVMDAGSL